MQNMDFNLLIIAIGFYTVLLLIVFLVIKPYLEKRNNINLMRAQNEKMDIMMKLDPKAAEDEIDKLVKNYISEYIFYQFTIHDTKYIRKEETGIMVKSIIRSIMLELSELYIFYIKIVRDVSDETDILEYITKKVREHALEFITEYNREK